MLYKAVFQKRFETKPNIYIYINNFIFQEMVAVLFLKKTFEKKSFFQILRGQKSKVGCFYEFIPGFPKKDWVQLSLNIENVVTIIWFKKSVGLRNLPFVKFWKKIIQLWCPGNQRGQLSRSPNWVEIVPYDDYH